MCEFESGYFWYFLVGVLGILIGLNLLAVIGGHFLSVIPLLFQSVVLGMAWVRHPWTKGIVRLWSALLAIGAGLQVVGMVIAPSGTVSPLRAAGWVLLLLAGAAIYFLGKRYILTPTQVALRDAKPG